MKEGLIYENIISTENLFAAWQEFLVGKSKKPDVQVFASALIDNILQLNADLANRTYEHGGYFRFNISDPKPRNISKASVRDRLVHHAIYRILYPFFDRTFIGDSYSCRINKGIHKAIARFHSLFGKVSRNNTRTCWVLKCDIKKFFASINHDSLLGILTKSIPDQNIIWLMEKIIRSFSTAPGIGLPLGNLTSQLFVNIYMNEFDQHMKHELKIKNYIRYADDFVILSDNRHSLTELIVSIQNFLQDRLELSLHPNKLTIKTFGSGIDFLGWVHFPNHRVLRTATKKHMLRRIRSHPTEQTMQSYLGLLGQGNTLKIQDEIMSEYWVMKNDQGS